MKKFAQRGSARSSPARLRFHAALLSAVLLASTSLLGSTQAAAEGGVKSGLLTCDVSGGWGLVLGSSRTMFCTYAPASGMVQHYSGRITKIGVDLGFVSKAVVVWAIFAPAIDVSPGALTGVYAGANGSFSLGYGGGANVLLGGGGNSITLQPLSVEGDEGLGISGGLAAISLEAQS